MTTPNFVVDIDGARVEVGDIVKVLEIDAFIKPEKEEVEKVMSMVGEEFEVDEIDEHGRAWVTKWWRMAENEINAHGIALASQQMKLVSSKHRN